MLKWRGQLVNNTLFPSDSLVEFWYNASNKVSKLAAYQAQAFDAYKKLSNQQTTTAFSRFVSVQFDWAPYTVIDQSSSFKDLGNGAWSNDLAQSYSEHTEVKHYTDKLFLNITNYSALQLLTLACGYSKVVYIPAYAQVKLLLNDLLNYQRSSLVINSTLFIIGAGAQVTIVDTYNPENQSAQLSSLWGCIGAGASVFVVQEHALSLESHVLLHDSWFLDSHAQLKIIKAVTGGALSSLQHDFMLEGLQASVSCNFASILKKNQHNAFSTRQYHTGEKTESSINIKNVLYDTSRALYEGTIFGSKEARAMLADQQQRALLMSNVARVCAIPSLEIKTKEVHCRHGSAVGKVNREQLLYLQSRGFTPEQAQKLLVEAFLEDISRGLLQEELPQVFALIQRIKNYCFLT
ncbi:SufD family Fe-S cluster assembly protein [Candidatus Dependentiae bacterium]|nr:SufD family Fe-S cluster assembly protein [Candidatus Dependentiae bacterium]